jgi:hypothetical protein
LFKKYKGAIILGINILIKATKVELVEIARVFRYIYKARIKINNVTGLHLRLYVILY